MSQTTIGEEGTPQTPDAALAPAGTRPNRRSLRVPYSNDKITLSLTNEQGQDEQFNTTGRNLSRGGLGLLIEREIEEGATCRVRLPTLSGEVRLLSGRVRGCRPVRGVLHEIGVVFDESIDLEQFITLQPTQRMIYAREKQAAAAEALALSGPAAPAAPSAAKPILSKLISQPGMTEKIDAYLHDLGQRIDQLATATQQRDIDTMRQVTEWVMETAQPHGFPTLCAVANCVFTYLEDDTEPTEEAREQVMELVSYMRRARPSAA